MLGWLVIPQYFLRKGFKGYQGQLTVFPGKSTVLGEVKRGLSTEYGPGGKGPQKQHINSVWTFWTIRNGGEEKYL